MKNCPYLLAVDLIMFLQHSAPFVMSQYQEHSYTQKIIKTFVQIAILNATLMNCKEVLILKKKPIVALEDLFQKSKETVDDNSLWEELRDKIKSIFANLPKTTYKENEEEME